MGRAVGDTLSPENGILAFRMDVGRIGNPSYYAARCMDVGRIGNPSYYAARCSQVSSV